MVCGIDTGGAGYCWGWGATGPQFGHLVPEPLSGGLRFSSISAGMGFVEGGYACGVTIEGTAYCWGSNTDGQLGNGTTTDSAVPVKVAGQP
jgi:alpha-tubulin suppressor-like RCC1 family protein